MRKTRLVIAVAVTMLSWDRSPVAAQESPVSAPTREAERPAIPAAPSVPLTPEAAVRIALDRNPVTRAAAEGVRVTEAAAGEARAPYYPTLSVSTSFTRWETHAFLPEGLGGPEIPSTIGPTNDWTAALRGRYTVYDGGRRAADLRQALAQQQVAVEEAARVRQDLALEVRRAFYALAAAGDAERVAQTNLARAEEHLRLAQERRAAGAVSGGDVIQAQVHVAEARLARVRIDSLLQQARGGLNTAMGLPLTTPIDTDSGEPVVPPDAMGVTGQLAQALAVRPVVNVAAHRVAAATEAISAARSAFGPQIAAELSAGLRDSDFFPTDRDWRAGVTVTWSLFDGFAKRHRLEGARAARARDEAELERTKQAVQSEVWSAHARLREMHEAIAAADVLIRDADENVRIARERYRVGAGTVNELLDAQAALARADAVRAQAEWDYRSARATYEWTIGRAVPGSATDAPDGGQ